MFLADALEASERLLVDGLRGKMRLVYLDPPYASQTDYVHEARLDGPADGRVRRNVAYADTWSKHGGRAGGIAAYLDMLAPRLEAMCELLRDDGTIWVQLDWRAAYLARVLLDEILGRDAFINEIVWRRAPNLGRQAASGQFGRTLDTIVVYGKPRARLKPPTRPEPVERSAVRQDDEGRYYTTAPRGDYTDASVARLEEEGRIHRAASGKVYVKYFVTEDADGNLCRERRVDALWTDVAPMRHRAKSERTGFPTQKPLELLERIIDSGTDPGDFVVDFFSGSGTTAEAAARRGRRFVVADASPTAFSVTRARLMRADVPASFEALGQAECPEGEAVDVRTEQRGGAVRVELVAPTDPMAWAVLGGARATDVLWHSERELGRRTTAAKTVAELPADSGASKVVVYADDGSRSEHAVCLGSSSASKRIGALAPSTDELEGLT